MTAPRAALLLGLIGLLASLAAVAATEVELLATEPAGATISLGLNQSYYLHIAYSTDEPVRIWARPFFRGEEVGAGSNPSRVFSGDGEALAWFFFLGEPGQQVDEIRISVGDGSRDGTRVIANWPQRIVSSANAAAPANEPDWLRRLKADDERLTREEFEARMSEPVGAGGLLLFGGFMLGVLALGLAGIAAPAWAVWRWRGAWRLAAAVPAAIVAFVILRIMLDTARDPSSHNLWPFEILYTAVLALVLIGALALVRKVTGAPLERY